MGDIGAIYGRVIPFARAMPVVFALPVAAEFVQHVAEVSIGFYVAGHAHAVASAPARMATGVVKVVAILLTVLIASRWWYFDGDEARALRPTAAFWRGMAIGLLVQVVMAVMQFGLTAAIVTVAGPEARVSATLALGLLVLLVTAGLQPWFVGLIVEDRAMDMRRSIAGIRGHLIASFGLLLIAAVPLMAVHYALGYGAMGRPAILLWPMLAADALLVGLLAVLIAAGSYVVYLRAAGRTAPPAPS